MTQFRVPEKVQRELEERALTGETSWIEFPKGSGIWAEYTAEERAIIRDLPRDEMEFVHAMKAEFNGTISLPPEDLESGDESRPSRPPDPDDDAHARRSDPWTSHAAAKSISPDALRESQKAVLECFNRYGEMHHEALVTTYQLERDEHGWPEQSESGLRTRTHELVEAGRLTDSGRTTVLPSGRKSIIWTHADPA